MNTALDIVQDIGGILYVVRIKIMRKSIFAFLSASNTLICSVAPNGLCSQFGSLICGIILAAKIVHLVSLSLTEFKPIGSFSSCTGRAATRQILSSGFPSRFDTNRAVQPQKMARGLIFMI